MDKNSRIIISHFDQIAVLLRDKLGVLWPSSKNTPPTEANIVTACVQAFTPEDYWVFTEIPIKPKEERHGRMDFFAFNKTDKYLVLGEMKSDKGNYADEILSDFSRLSAFSSEDFAYVDKPLSFNEVYIFIGYWTEVPDKISQLKDICDKKTTEHPLSGMITACDATYYASIDSDAKIPGTGLHLFFFLKKL